MVGADHLVAIRNVGFRAKEHGAVIGHAIQEPARRGGKHFHMLGGDAVGLDDGRLVAVGQNDLAEIAPRRARHLDGRQDAKLALDFGRDRLGQRARRGQQDRG